MRKFGIVDFEFYRKYNISKNSLFLMIELERLSSWAKAIKIEDDKTYYYLTVSKILEDIPMLQSKTSIRRALIELEELEIIESVNKDTNYPAYRLTEIGMEWGTSSVDKNTSCDDADGKKIYMSLSIASRIDKLPAEYMKNLQMMAKEHSEKNSLDYKETFQDFLDYHQSKGTRFINWLSAYRKWCSNKKKWISKKEKEKENYFSGDLYNG